MTVEDIKRDGTLQRVLELHPEWKDSFDELDRVIARMEANLAEIKAEAAARA